MLTAYIGLLSKLNIKTAIKVPKNKEWELRWDFNILIQTTMLPRKPPFV